jgi:hypothetical protein
LAKDHQTKAEVAKVAKIVQSKDLTRHTKISQGVKINEGRRKK